MLNLQIHLFLRDSIITHVFLREIHEHKNGQKSAVNTVLIVPLSIKQHHLLHV